MARSYREAIEVRGYELDSFGHVNHAVYVRYFEHARWKLLGEEGVTLAHFERWKRWPVIARLSVDFKRPAYLGDQLEVRTKISEHGRANFTFEQRIYRAAELIASAEVVAVMVNEKGKPADLPHEISKMWSDQDLGGGI